MLFLIAVGAGAAVLEVHRALHNNPNGDLKELRDREAALRKQLQVCAPLYVLWGVPHECKASAGACQQLSLLPSLLPAPASLTGDAELPLERHNSALECCPGP